MGARYLFILVAVYALTKVGVCPFSTAFCGGESLDSLQGALDQKTLESVSFKITLDKLLETKKNWRRHVVSLGINFVRTNFVP